GEERALTRLARDVVARSSTSPRGRGGSAAPATRRRAVLHLLPRGEGGEQREPDEGFFFYLFLQRSTMHGRGMEEQEKKEPSPDSLATLSLARRPLPAGEVAAPRRRRGGGRWTRARAWSAGRRRGASAGPSCGRRARRARSGR